MSGSIQPGPPAANAVQFADADIVDVRRYCGYPAYGAGPAGFQSWRYFQWYGELEYRLRNLTADEVAVVQTHLTNCRSLDAAVVNVGSGITLQAAQAAVYTHNPNEIADREGLLTRERMRLCAFLGVPPGPSMGTATGTVRLVV